MFIEQPGGSRGRTLLATAESYDVQLGGKKWQEENVKCDASPCLMWSRTISVRDNSAGYWSHYRWPHGTAVTTVCDEEESTYHYHTKCYKAMNK